MRVFLTPETTGFTFLLALTLGVLAAKGIGEGLYYATLYSQDFQWSPTVLLSEGRDPFAWYLAGNADDRIILSQEPNYLHLLYVMLMPLTKFSWATAKMFWALCNIAMGACAALYLAREAGLRGWTFICAYLTFFAASPFAHAVGNGQQSLLCLFALTLAWRRRLVHAGGAALAVGATKYSFAPPLALWLILERRWATLAGAATVGAAGLLIFAVLCRANPLTIAFEPFEVSALATGVGLADVMSLSRALGAAPRVVDLAALATIGAGVALLWRARRRLDDLAIFALLCQLSLFALFHNLYDYVFLTPLFVRALTFPPILRAVTLAYVGYFWFVVHLIDASPATKTPIAIGAMALASAAMFTAIAMRRMKVEQRPDMASAPLQAGGRLRRLEPALQKK